MDCEYEECVLSIVRGGEGWDEEYSSLYEFNHHLNGGILEHERSGVGWVFWRESERQMQQQNQIITLLRHFAPSNWVDYIVQYWRVMEVEEGGKWHHYLSTSHHPFCRYRKLCRGHVYVVDMELGADDQQQPLIGGVGRAYRNKQPESIPDLRLYSTNEFPMRDEATRCGFRGYVALPLFDVLTNQCYGVLEILYRGDEVVYDIPVSLLHEALQIAGLRTTHSFTPHSGYKRPMIPKCDITDMLELAVMTVPLLYFAQVWIPCKQCLNMTTNLCCMKKASSHSSDDATELYIYDYDRACSFHNIQSDARSSHSTFCDLNISKNPLSHYAQRFGMCHYFAISLQSLNNPNHLYVLVFIFRSKIRDDSLHLLSRMMEMHLMKSFKFVPEVQLLKEISVQSRQPNAVECGSIDSLDLIHSYKQELSELNFTAYLETVDSCCLRPSLESRMTRIGGWVFCCPAGETLLENDCNSDPLLVPIMIKEKIKTFMNNIAVKLWIGYWIIQFWAPKLVEDRCYLQTSDQPIAVGRLAKGIASFRKKCLKHYYPVDGEAKEDELGPLGRVFRSGNLEISPHLWCYTRKEFPIRNYALHCCSPEGYFALPIWDDEHNHKCVGVLEFLGFSRYSLEHIERELKEVKLRTTHIDLQPRFLANERPDNSMFGLDQTLSYKEAALTELRNTLQLIDRHNIPQLNKADVYVLHGNGMVGMVLASENKSCFCRNLSEFGIADHPLLYYEMNEIRDGCFAICLQSSLTDDLLYVLEFFLDQGPATYEYLLSFLNFLLPILKHELKSFKIASGKQLGEELIVEVIEFSEANVLDFSGSEEANVFPIKFKSVQYIQKEHQQAREQLTEAGSVAASCSNAREKGKRKTGTNLSLEVLESHFGKKLKDVAQELGIGKSTIKRACRGYGIDRWPSNKNNMFHFERECSKGSQQHMLPSTSNLQPLDPSLHLNVPHTITEEKVMIKVKYEEDIIKFELYLSLGLAKLMQEVARRIKQEDAFCELEQILLSKSDNFSAV